MSNTDFWELRRNRIITRKGGWKPGVGATSHGYSLLDELVGKVSFFQLLFLNVMGHLPEPRLAYWIECTFMCLSFPDPRIWCNQVAALGGSTRCTPTAAVAAGTMASDSTLYGPGSISACIEFIEKAKRLSDAGIPIRECLSGLRRTQRGILAPGFSRPISSLDERVRAMERVTAELGFEHGEYLRLAYRIDHELRQLSGDAMTVLGFMVAFWLDQGLDTERGARLFSLCVNAGVHACYSEAADEPADGFLPMRCEDIEYVGKPPRALPGKGEHA
jgi:citrate synthase